MLDISLVHIYQMVTYLSKSISLKLQSSIPLTYIIPILVLLCCPMPTDHLYKCTQAKTKYIHLPKTLTVAIFVPAHALFKLRRYILIIVRHKTQDNCQQSFLPKILLPKLSTIFYQCIHF